ENKTSARNGPRLPHRHRATLGLEKSKGATGTEVTVTEVTVTQAATKSGKSKMRNGGANNQQNSHTNPNKWGYQFQMVLVFKPGKPLLADAVFLRSGSRSGPLSVCTCVRLWFHSSPRLLLLRSLRSAPPHRIGRFVIQRPTHRTHDGLQALHPPEPFEVRFHYGPWRGERARPQQHVFHGFVVAAPLLAVAPILRRQLPTLVRCVLALLEPLQLFFGTDLQPELHHHGAGVPKLPFEIVDLPVGPLPGVLRAESLHALHQHAPVPAPVEDQDLFFVGGQQPPPESPQIMVRFVLAFGRGDRKDFVSARVE